METVGSLIDKLSINELKIYHMQEQRGKVGIDSALQVECEDRLAVLCAQRSALADELQTLLDRIASGKSVALPFRQMKMYNEKKFR